MESLRQALVLMRRSLRLWPFAGLRVMPALPINYAGFKLDGYPVVHFAGRWLWAKPDGTWTWGAVTDDSRR